MSLNFMYKHETPGRHAQNFVDEVVFVRNYSVVCSSSHDFAT